jgi:hypothetical protein
MSVNHVTVAAFGVGNGLLEIAWLYFARDPLNFEDEIDNPTIVLA